MSSLDFGVMCEDAAERLYLEHHGIKGMKWGIRRFQNEDGTLTPEGKERYKSIMSGGKSKAADEFYRKAVAKDSYENFQDVVSSLPMQHVLSRLRKDSKVAYEAGKEENVQREKLIREGYAKLSQDEKDDFVKKAVDEATKYYEDMASDYGLDVDPKTQATELVKDRIDYFDNKFRDLGYVDDWIMSKAEEGFLFTGYGQWYAANRDKLNKILKPYSDRAESLFDALDKNCLEYVKEFTEGFGEFELKDLSKKYGRAYTVNDKLSVDIRDELYNRNMSYGMLSVDQNWSAEKLSEFERGMVKYYDKWRKESFKKNGMTKLY